MPAIERTPQSEALSSLEAAARAALEHWDDTFISVQLLKQRENAVFGVVTREGTRAALRLHRLGYHTDAALRSELAWMGALAASGLPTPTPLPTRAGELFQTFSLPGSEPRQADLLSWVDGAPVASTGDLLPAGLDVVEHFTRVGELLARLHAHADTWRRPPGFVRHAWDAAGLVGAAPLWGRYWELPALSPAERGLLAAARGGAAADLAALSGPAADYGLIHADPIPENLLRQGDQLSLIDFDDGGFGWRLFDLATALYVHLPDPAYARVEQGLLSGYRAVRPLPDESLEALPLFLFLRATTYLGWIQTRPGSPQAEAMTPALIGGACACAEVFLQSRS